MIVNEIAVPAVTVIVADADCVVSDKDVAVTVTFAGLGTVAGAVYRPLVLTVPVVRFPPITPFTDQYTPELLLLTVAENWAVVLVATEAVVGEIETAPPVDVELELLLPPPHAASRDSDTMTNNRRNFILMGLLRLPQYLCGTWPHTRTFDREDYCLWAIDARIRANQTRKAGERLGVNYKLTTILRSCANSSPPGQGITRVTTSVTPAIYSFLRFPAYYALNGVRVMEKDKPNVLLCIWCRRRITGEELQSGRHDHIDVEERMEYDLAVNNSGD